MAYLLGESTVGNERFQKVTGHTIKTTHRLPPRSTDPPGGAGAHRWRTKSPRPILQLCPRSDGKKDCLERKARTAKKIDKE